MRRKIREFLEELNEAPLIIRMFLYFLTGVVTIVLTIFITSVDLMFVLGTLIIYIIGYLVIRLLGFITREREKKDE